MRLQAEMVERRISLNLRHIVEVITCEGPRRATRVAEYCFAVFIFVNFTNIFLRMRAISAKNPSRTNSYPPCYTFLSTFFLSALLNHIKRLPDLPATNFHFFAYLHPQRTHNPPSTAADKDQTRDRPTSALQA